VSNEGSCLFWDLAEKLCGGQKPPRTATIFPGPHSVVDVVKGIVPLEWVNTLCGVGLSLAQAKSVPGRLVHVLLLRHIRIYGVPSAMPRFCVIAAS